MSSITELPHKRLEKCDGPTNIPIIVLVYPDGYRKTYFMRDTIRGAKHLGLRPIGIEWYNTDGYIPNKDDIDWLHSSLAHVFVPISFKSAIQGLLNE